MCAHDIGYGDHKNVDGRDFAIQRPKKVVSSTTFVVRDIRHGVML